MEQEVYADLLFLINFSMDYLCLYICARVLHRKMKLSKMLIASSLGGVYSVLSLFLYFPAIISLIIDCAVCLLMCTVVFHSRERSIGSLFISTFLYIGISMMSGGCMTAIFNLLDKLDLPLEDIDADGISTYLFALLALIAGIITLKSGQIISRRAPIRECKLTVDFCGESFVFSALSDSGNLVRDPISGIPVIFLDRRVLEERIDLSFIDLYKKGKVEDDSPCKDLRLIAINTASGSSLAVAASAKSITAEFQDKKGKSITLELNALISPTKIDKNALGYNAIIPSEIIKP